MKTLAIIAEYNPFHNGHQYMLSQAKKLTHADYSIAIISGSFLQRGQAAMWNKYQRASMAVSSGIDLCIELPFAYATGSAHDFAYGAVGILNSLNTVDYLCFGAETANLELLSAIADITLNEPEEYRIQLKANLQSGISYAAARANALVSYCTKEKLCNYENLNSVITEPNNILAIEYLCALKKHNSQIKPIVIKRKGSNYHEHVLKDTICSAYAIRKELDSLSGFNDKIRDFVPDYVYSSIRDSFGISSPVSEDDITPFLQSCLIKNSNFCACDINSDLEDKIKKLPCCISFSDAVFALKSKDINLSRISRGLIHLILDYKIPDRELFINNGYAFYANILSFKKNSSGLLKNINLNGKIPLITKKADFDKYILQYDINKNAAQRMWELDIKSTGLYNCMVYNRYGTILPNDFNISLPII